jgi:hypothetical protein
MGAEVLEELEEAEDPKHKEMADWQINYVYI